MKNGLKSTGHPLAGPDLSGWTTIERGYVACVAGKIVAVGPMSELNLARICPDTCLLDATSCVVMPGLVEYHTHLVFGGNRAPGFKRKLRGESCLAILAGGGILSTVRATRAAPEAELLANALHHLDGFRRYGVTTVEAKSGYGPDRDTELRLVRVARQAGRQQSVRVVLTFLGRTWCRLILRRPARGPTSILSCARYCWT